MGKTEASPIERAHQRIYQCLKDDLIPQTVTWHVSRRALYYFEMMDEYVAVPVLNSLGMVDKSDFVGMLFQHKIILDETMLPNTAELRDGTDVLAIVDFPEDT